MNVFETLLEIHNRANTGRAPNIQMEHARFIAKKVLGSQTISPGYELEGSDISWSYSTKGVCLRLSHELLDKHNGIYRFDSVSSLGIFSINSDVLQRTCYKVLHTDFEQSELPPTATSLIEYFLEKQLSLPYSPFDFIEKVAKEKIPCDF